MLADREGVASVSEKLVTNKRNIHQWRKAKRIGQDGMWAQFLAADNEGVLNMLSNQDPVFDKAVAVLITFSIGISPARAERLFFYPKI